MKFFRFLPAVVFLAFLSCNSQEPITPQKVDVNLSFSHLVDGSPVQLDQLIYQNSLGQEFSIKTIKYFVSQVKLYRADNSIIEFPDIHFTDIRLPETMNYVLSEQIPAGDYKGISFVYGLIPSENISGRFTEPPESLMEWPEPMGGGYHYMKLEGEFKTPATESFFNFHSGALNGTAYEIHVDLSNQPFSVGKNNIDITLEMEIQNWFKNPTDWDFTYFGPAIMGNAEAQKTIQENGADVFSFVVNEKLE